MFTTPFGKPTDLHISANNNADKDVNFAGLITIVFPIAKAGATFHVNINNGKFQGTIPPTTPNGL